MDIKITMLNVNDGDAIIIELIKADETLVMVIDGGEPRYYNTILKPKLENVLKDHDKIAPDVVVCTHFDSDHIGGLIPLIKDYISDIKEVWVHKTPSLLKGFIEKAKKFTYLTEMSLDAIESLNFKILVEKYQPDEKRILNEKAYLIIESFRQLEEFFDLIPKSKIKQVFHRNKPLPDWQEITVLGPTKHYYDTLFPTRIHFRDFILAEALDHLPSKKFDLRLLESAGINPCDTLKKDAETRLTSTNKASIIIAIDNADKRYLFTGDAGIESFKSIPNWNTELRDLYFLKIPHHASDNNISKEIIELMQPVYAYNSGDKYQDDAVLKCLSEKARNREVRTTKNNGDLYFDK